MSDLYKRIFTAILMLVGLFFIVSGVIGLRNADRFTPATGTIRSIQLVSEAIEENDVDIYEVMVEYTVDGQSYLSDIGQMKDDYSVGKEIDIIYDPDHPETITLPGKTTSVIGIVIGALAFFGPIVVFLRRKTKREKFAQVPADNLYAPSVKGGERELYFLSDTGTVKVGHRIEDANRSVLYEAKVTKFTLSAPTGMDFIDHARGTTTPHLVGHEISVEYNSILADNRHSFTLDGEDIWDHLKRCGISVESSFMEGRIVWPQYRILRDGEEIALVQSSSAYVHEEDAEAKGRLGNLMPVPGFYRIWTREENLDLLFVAVMAFARTGANDDNGGNFGLLFNRKRQGR